MLANGLIAIDTTLSEIMAVASPIQRPSATHAMATVVRRLEGRLTVRSLQGL
jgi:hypothetical protein